LAQPELLVLAVLDQLERRERRALPVRLDQRVLKGLLAVLALRERPDQRDRRDQLVRRVE
jgi:hypothetical protein